MNRKRKTRPNELCPCGSGKKFKKCHGTADGMHRHCRGHDAEKAMLNILAANKHAQCLASQVASFYGNFLDYFESPSYASSHFEMEWDHEPVALRYVTVRLQLGTDRTAEALSHELLHVQLPIEGFPCGVRINVPDELDVHATKFIDMIGDLNNLIQHEIIFDRFLALGFKSAFFLRRPSPAPNYELLAAKATASQGYIDCIGFPFWCLEWYRHWISVRHGLGSQTIRDAENAERWGSSVHADLPDPLRTMREWTERGEFKNRAAYPGEVNNLLSSMRLVPFTLWASLEGKVPGKPGTISLIVGHENA